MTGKLRNSSRYHGPLVGLEIEAYASWLLTGADDGEDEASLSSLRRVARHLRETTGLPFRAVADLKDNRSHPTERIPTSSPLNPIWAIRSDYSLDPVAAPDEEHGVGIEVITPPLEPVLAGQAGHLLVDSMLEDGFFVPGYGAGVHVNVSVPGLVPSDAPGLALLDPFRSEVSNSRLEEFADPFFDTVIECLATDTSSPDQIPALVSGLVRRTRGMHLTNVLPLLIGSGYIELRHLGSREFFSDPARAVRLATKCIDLLTALPKAKTLRRMRDVIDCSHRVRELGGDALAEVAANADWVPVKMRGDYEEARRRLLAHVLLIVQKDDNLLRRFPWASGFPNWRVERRRRRNSLRSPYAVTCVDPEQIARTIAALSFGS